MGFSKRTVSLILPVLIVSATAWADDCKLPDLSIYSAPLARKFIGFIQAKLPNVRFDASTSEIASTVDVALKTVDGTVLDVRGSFEISAEDVIDSEGNVTGCTLVLEPYEGAVQIVEVTNRKSGHNILPEELILSDDGSSLDLGINYPYSQ